MKPNQSIVPVKKLSQNKKTFIVSGLMTSRSNLKFTAFNKGNSILNTIDKEFSQPSEYLNVHSPIQVGKRPQGPQYDKNNNLISFTYVGGSATTKALRRESKPVGNPFNRKSLSSSISSSFVTSTDKTKQHQLYDVIDEKGIRKLFADIKSQTESNKLRSTIDLNELPSDIKVGLNAQEKSLGFNQRESSNTTRLSRYLSQKTRKKEKELLINNLDAYRLKRQIIKTIASNVPDEVKYGLNNWTISLRRPEHFKGERETFINVGTEKKPFWTKIREKNPKEEQCTSKPRLEASLMSNEFVKKPYSNNRYFSESSLNRIERLSDLAVTGKNLLQFEYENVAGIPGRKRVYKKGHINSLSLPKHLFGGEYSKSFENLLSEQVIFANYNRNSIVNNVSTASLG